MKEINGKKSEGIKTLQNHYAVNNDMDDSFFHYLADLKKFDNSQEQDKDNMIWQAECAMNVFRDCIFSLAPAVENFCQILEDIAENKLDKNDVFMASSLNSSDIHDGADFFNEWQSRINSLLNDLKNSYNLEQGAQIRDKLVKECCLLKVNYDYMEIFFNRINDYLTLWSEEDSLHIRNHRKLLRSYTNEQKIFLAGKLLITPDTPEIHLEPLFAASQRLTEIKHCILSSHLRLVISIAQKFRNRGVPFNDIVQEGNLGLMRAIDKFDPLLGHKFSTYAVWWIKQNIIHGIAEQSRTIRIPAHMLNLINKINHTEQQLLQLLGREPESEEIAKELDLSVAKVNAIRCMARQAISLQSPVGSNDGTFSLEDTLKDNSENKNFTDFDKDVTYQMLYKLLKTLSKREQEIIILRFGLFGNKPTPFTELSERFNLTRERVRQLELKILNKLRTPDKLKLLDHFSPPKK